MKATITAMPEDQRQNDQEIAYLANASAPITVFIAEPLKGRMIVDACDDDTPEEVAQRQRNIDVLTGWNISK